MASTPPHDPTKKSPNGPPGAPFANVFYFSSGLALAICTRSSQIRISRCPPKAISKAISRRIEKTFAKGAPGGPFDDFVVGSWGGVLTEGAEMNISGVLLGVGVAGESGKEGGANCASKVV